MTGFRFRAVTADEAGFRSEVLHQLTAYLDATVVADELPGAVLLLARGDQVVLAHVTGFEDVATREPLRSDSIFELYSMTKPLTAAGFMTLYEDGQIGLDDPVSTYLPEFKDFAKVAGTKASREPTIRETLTHTAGFSFGRTPEAVKAFVEKVNWSRERSLTSLVKLYAALPAGYEPGTDWEYGVATDLQAEIAERITGERFDLFLERRIFEPLGMTDTGFVLSHNQNRRIANGHVHDAESGRLRPVAQAERIESIFPMGGTSLKSTALDYARFARMLLNRGTLGDRRVLKPETVDLMLSNHLPDALMQGTRGVLHYEIGGGNGHAVNGMVCIDPAKAGRTVGRGTYEWGGAFGTFFWVDPEFDILCIGMLNRQREMTARPPEVIAQEIVYRALRR